MVRRHKWVWAIPWYCFWKPKTKRCSRCGAELRFPRTGPRKGIEYSYRAPGDFLFENVRTLPACEPPELSERAARLAAAPVAHQSER